MTRSAGVTALIVCSLFAAVAIAQQTEPPKQKQPPKQDSKRLSPAAEKAREQYSFNCQPCHGPDGKGLLPGTDLTTGKWKHGSTLAAIAKTIREGIPGTVMEPNKDRLSEAEILELARLVRSFDTKLSGKKPPIKK